MAATGMETDVSWEELIQLETEFDDVDSQISTSRLPYIVFNMAATAPAYVTFRWMLT